MSYEMGYTVATVFGAGGFVFWLINAIDFTPDTEIRNFVEALCVGVATFFTVCGILTLMF